MNKDANIIIRIDSDIKKEFQDFVYEKGYTTSLVLSAFIYDVIEKKKLPTAVVNKLKPLKQKESISIPFIKKCLREIIDNFKKKDDIKKAYLFGSYARGEENFTSDIDIRMEVDGTFDFFDLAAIAYELEEKTGRKVDMITSGNLDPRFYNEIKQEEICLYE